MPWKVKPEIRQRHENEVNGKCNIDLPFRLVFKIESLITVISCLQLIMALPYFDDNVKIRSVMNKISHWPSTVKGDGLKLIQLKRDNQRVKGMVAIAAKFNYFQNEQLASVIFNNLIKVTRFLRSGCPTFATNESIWKNPFVSLFSPTFMV